MKDEVVSIDGKTVCGSGGGENAAIQMVSAWANANQLVLGQVKINDKSNEIKAVAELLEMLYLKGCIVTIDAMGCQKEIIKKVTKRKADYVLSLKENDPDLYNDVKFYFENDGVKKTKVTENKKHGRLEKREYYLETSTDWLNGRDEWTNLNAIGMVKSTVLEKDKLREETRYFITSLMSVDLFAKAVRAHWGIESMHWCLDVVFHEDDCTVRANNVAENFAVTRHIALNILKNHPIKMSLARKRRKCLYDSDFMADVLISAFSSFFSCVRSDYLEVLLEYCVEFWYNSSKRGSNPGKILLCHFMPQKGIVLKMRIAICEDEDKYAEQLIKYINEWAESKNIFTEIFTYAAAEKFLYEWEDSEDYDLLFLDIKMGSMSGMDLAKIIRKSNKNVAIIFATNMREYAIEGYTVDAMQYLLKPVRKSDCFACLDRVCQSDRIKKYFLFNDLDKTFRIPHGDIIYIEKFAHNATLVTVKDKYTLRKTMIQLLEELNDDLFAQCHKSYYHKYPSHGIALKNVCRYV